MYVDKVFVSWLFSDNINIELNFLLTDMSEVIFIKQVHVKQL